MGEERTARPVLAGRRRRPCPRGGLPPLAAVAGRRRRPAAGHGHQPRAQPLERGGGGPRGAARAQPDPPRRRPRGGAHEPVGRRHGRAGGRSCAVVARRPRRCSLGPGRPRAPSRRPRRPGRGPADQRRGRAGRGGRRRPPPRGSGVDAGGHGARRALRGLVGVAGSRSRARPPLPPRAGHGPAAGPGGHRAACLRPGRGFAELAWGPAESEFTVAYWRHVRCGTSWPTSGGPSAPAVASDGPELDAALRGTGTVSARWPAGRPDAARTGRDRLGRGRRPRARGRMVSPDRTSLAALRRSAPTHTTGRRRGAPGARTPARLAA